MKSPIRVLMLASYFPKPHNPFMGTWALSQAKALKSENINLKVVSFTSWVPSWAVATRGGAHAYATCPGSYTWDGLTVSYPRWLWYPVPPIKRWEYRNPELFLPLAWHTARRYLEELTRTFRPDVLYAHHTAINGYIAYRLKLQFGIPFVVTDHDLGEIADCTRYPRRLRLFEKVATEAFCMVSVARRMEVLVRRMLPHARTATVHNGTDDLISLVKHNERRRDRLVVFSCGAFYARKDFPLLVEAFSAVAREFPHAVLRIAGDGEERPLIENTIRSHGLEGRVELLGFCSAAQVRAEMNDADVFALIGWDEPFGVVYAEALSAALPIVCCEDCGITDVVTNEVQGLIVPPRDASAAADAIRRLLADASLRNCMGTAGRRLYEARLTWRHNARAMYDLLAEACHAGSVHA